MQYMKIYCSDTNIIKLIYLTFHKNTMEYNAKITLRKISHGIQWTIDQPQNKIKKTILAHYMWVIKPMVCPIIWEDIYW